MTEVKAGRIDAISSKLSLDEMMGLSVVEVVVVLNGSVVVTIWVLRDNGGVLEINFRLTTLGVELCLTVTGRGVVLLVVVVVVATLAADRGGKVFRLRTATRDGIFLLTGAGVSDFSTWIF
jgi:hypothetical protein